MKLNNLSDLDDELFNEIAQSFDTPNLIELLGMAKNCIVEALDSGLPLPALPPVSDPAWKIRYRHW